MKNFLILIFILTLEVVVLAHPYDLQVTTSPHSYIYHQHNESSYQHAYQKKYGGIEEYELPDRTRVDLLTDKYAIEFDFCVPPKIYEAIGQALHYSVMTDKKPKIVLILDTKYAELQKKYYFSRVQRVGKVYNIEVEYITDDILNIDKNGHCPYSDCKCNK